MSGPVAMLLAVSGARVDISGGGGAADSVGAPATALAQIALESDGDVVSTTSTGSSDDGDWIAPKAAAPGTYEVLAHQDSGAALDVTSAALDTWLALTSTRSWSISQLIAGSKAAQLTISIRLGAAVLSSGVFTLAAEVV